MLPRTKWGTCADVGFCRHYSDGDIDRQSRHERDRHGEPPYGRGFRLSAGSGQNRIQHEPHRARDDIVRDRIERVTGVSRSNFYGGGERELRVIVDPERMARYGLTVSEIVAGAPEGR